MFGLKNLFGKPAASRVSVLHLPPMVVDYGKVDADGFFYGGKDVGEVSFPPSSTKGVVVYEAKLLYFKRVFSLDRVVEAIHAIDMDSPVMWEPANVEQLRVFLGEHFYDVMCDRKMYPVLGLGTTSAHVDDPLVPVLTLNISYNTGFPIQAGTAWSRRDYTTDMGACFLATRPVQGPIGVQ